MTASLFATLNDMFGNRTVCGFGRGDSARRVIGQQPASLATMAEAMHVIKELAEGREVAHNGAVIRIPWVRDGKLEIWMAAYGPKALRLVGEQADGFILQTADPGHRAVDDRLGPCRRARPPAATRTGSPCAWPHPPMSARTWRTSGTSCAGSAGWSATTSRTWSHATVDDGVVPRALTDYIKGRADYDYSHHGRAGNPSADFVPDAIVDRFCLLGPASAHVERLRELAELGVGQFALYLMHDQARQTLDAYGSEIIPALS